MSYINSQFKDPWPTPAINISMSDGSDLAGSWSEWAIKKVVVSRANNEWPNPLAWIIARFFVSAGDTTRFFSEMANDQHVSDEAAMALLGQPVSNDVAMRAEAARHIRGLQAVVDGLGKALENREFAWTDMLSCDSPPLDPEQDIANIRDHLALSKEIEQRVSIVERYLARARQSLNERQLADAFCSVWLCGMNALQLEDVLESANIPVEVSSDDGDDFAHRMHDFDSDAWDAGSASESDDDGVEPSSPITADEVAAFAAECAAEPPAPLPSLRMFPKGQASAFR